MTKHTLTKKFAALWISAAMTGASLNASAAPWTTVGSAGTVDESDLATVLLSGAGANVAANAPLPETVTLRYNVVAVDGLLKNFGNLGGVNMDAVFRDNAGTARIKLRLREVENRRGVLRTVLTLDSDAFPPAAEFQSQSVNSCAGTPFTFDFDRKTYYVEAELSKGSAEALPSLGAIQVSAVSCVNIE